MRKTARTVVWEGAGAQSPAPDPIVKMRPAAMNPAILLSRQWGQIRAPLLWPWTCYKPSAPRLKGDHPAGWVLLGRPAGSHACTLQRVGQINRPVSFRQILFVKPFHPPQVILEQPNH